MIEWTSIVNFGCSSLSLVSSAVGVVVSSLSSAMVKDVYTMIMLHKQALAQFHFFFEIFAILQAPHIFRNLFPPTNSNPS